MAFHVLERDRPGGQRLANALQQAVETVGQCERCQTLTEGRICHLCQNPQRDSHTLCVVETPADVLALEQATHYQGHYFVLGGRLSPLDDIGPNELGLDRLRQRLQTGDIQELILATTTTVEGEATAHYVSELAADSGSRITRIAHGVPLGGELEYIDSGTLAHAFASRNTL
jgi:recombination protein RecR